MKDVLALTYHEHGKPLEVLKVGKVSVAEPKPGEVLVAMRCAVIHPSDMGMIGGSYGRLKSLPAVAGREGVGEIVALGDGVDGALLGRRVSLVKADGAWVEALTLPAEGLDLIPEGVSDELAAQAWVNPPTAVRLLADFVELGEGDWIIQNAGNSAVGFCVAGLAQSLGLNCLSVVRDLGKWEKPLLEAGATLVRAEDSGYEKEIKDLTGGALPRLGLNSIGGDSVMRLIKSLGESASLVTFGGMTGEKVRFPTRELIFKDIALRGFWMDRWYRQASQADREALANTVFQGFEKGVFDIPVSARYSLAEGIRAVEAALGDNRRGKVLLKGDWQPT